MIVVFHDISQIRAMAQQLLWQASHDALTGLVNRREFERRLTELIETARDPATREHALMFMDLDNFKAVNDTCGHTAGDELLRQLTAVMLSRMRGSDTLARLGGDEFGALLESCPFDQALRIANAMRETVREFRFVWEDKTFSVGVSIGLVPITAESGDLSTRAEPRRRMLLRGEEQGPRPRAGRTGRRRRSAERQARRAQVVSQINQAFELGRFRLYRQRIVPLAHGAQPGAELRGARAHGRPRGQSRPADRLHARGRALQPAHLDRALGGELADRVSAHAVDCPGAIARASRTSAATIRSISPAASINDRSLPDFLRNLLTRYQLPARPAVLRDHRDDRDIESDDGRGAHARAEGHGMPLRARRFRHRDVVLRVSQAPAGRRDEDRGHVRDATWRPIRWITRSSTRSTASATSSACRRSRNRSRTRRRSRRSPRSKIDYAQGYFIAEPEAMRASSRPASRWNSRRPDDVDRP